MVTVSSWQLLTSYSAAVSGIAPTGHRAKRRPSLSHRRRRSSSTVQTSCYCQGTDQEAVLSVGS